MEGAQAGCLVGGVVGSDTWRTWSFAFLLGFVLCGFLLLTLKITSYREDLSKDHKHTHTSNTSDISHPHHKATKTAQETQLWCTGRRSKGEDSTVRPILHDLQRAHLKLCIKLCISMHLSLLCQTLAQMYAGRTASLSSLWQGGWQHQWLSN